MSVCYHFCCAQIVFLNVNFLVFTENFTMQNSFKSQPRLVIFVTSIICIVNIVVIVIVISSVERAI